MTFQTELVAAPNSQEDVLTNIVAVATSKHVSAAVIATAGTGYTVGDVLTLTAHGSMFLDCELEVLAITGGGGTGPIDFVRINKGGAIADRLLSAVVNAAGSGYIIGDILEVQGGTHRERAKVRVATVSGSTVLTVTVYESGGSYAVDPTLTGQSTLTVGHDNTSYPSGNGGNDACTLDLTMQAEMGVTGITVTGGTGSSADFDLTLTATGWTTEFNKNQRDHNGRFEKEVVMKGTVAGGDAPYIGFMSYTQTSGMETRRGLGLFGMTAFNPVVALNAQSHIGPIGFTTSENSGAHVLITEEVAENNSWWIRFSDRAIAGVIRGNIVTEGTAYHSFYLGLANGFGPLTTTPYPIVAIGSSFQSNRSTTDDNSTGLSEMRQIPGSATAGPGYYLRKSTLVWRQIRNSGDPSTVHGDDVMLPLGTLDEAADPHFLCEDDNWKRYGNEIGSMHRSLLSDYVFPAPGTNDEYPLIPLTIVSRGLAGTNDVDTTIVGELDGCFWVCGTKADGSQFNPEDFVVEDKLLATEKRYYCFPCVTTSLGSRRYLFFCIFAG